MNAHTTQRDFYTEEGARTLAAMIVSYWRRYDREPDVWVESIKVETKGRHVRTYWIVKSNMVNGCPVA